MFEREFDFHEHKAAVLLEMAAKGPFHHTSEKVQERALFDVMQSFEHYHKTKHHLVGGGPPATAAVLLESQSSSKLRAGGFFKYVKKALSAMWSAIKAIGKFIRALLKSIYVGIGVKFDMHSGAATTLEFCFGGEKA
jgi:hypothetical protein